MLAGQTIQETGGRPGTIPVNNERTCSQCRHWDPEHAQQSDLDEDGVLIQEFFARCMNPESYCARRYMEANEGCGDFERR